jgi:hypothetical protein
MENSANKSRSVGGANSGPTYANTSVTAAYFRSYSAVPGNVIGAIGCQAVGIALNAIQEIAISRPHSRMARIPSLIGLGPARETRRVPI